MGFDSVRDFSGNELRASIDMVDGFKVSIAGKSFSSDEFFILITKIFQQKYPEDDPREIFKQKLKANYLSQNNPALNKFDWSSIRAEEIKGRFFPVKIDEANIEPLDFCNFVSYAFWKYNYVDGANQEDPRIRFIREVLNVEIQALGKTSSSSLLELLRQKRTKTLSFLGLLASFVIFLPPPRRVTAP